MIGAVRLPDGVQGLSRDPLVRRGVHELPLGSGPAGFSGYHSEVSPRRCSRAQHQVFLGSREATGLVIAPPEIG